MNTINKFVAVALLLATVSVAGASQALAATNQKASSNTQNWSFDSLYQTVTGISLSDYGDAVEATVAVAPVTNPATSIAKPKTVAKTVMVSVTGYSSTKDQTDETPFITAQGTYVRDGIIAANFLPFGTAVKIPELFGNKIFIVEDRMNSRYWYNVDVWFPSRDMAKQFGRKTVKIEIVS